MPAGRPSKYSDKFCETAHKLATNGATDVEMADALGVHVATLYRWRAERPEFREATQLGKDAADDRVEASLFHRAVGYSHNAVKIFMPAGAKNPVVAEYREHYPPETAAASLWLRNRRPESWRDKQDHEHTGKDGTPLVPVLNVFTSTDDRSSPPSETVKGPRLNGH